MRFLKVLLGSLLWIVSGILGLLGALLSVTVILLPIGVPLLMLARRVFRTAAGLVLPRKVTHPVEELGKQVPDPVSRGRAGRKARKRAGRKLTRKAGDVRDRAGRSVKKQRKKLPV